jgi:PKD repeat protein
MKQLSFLISFVFCSFSLAWSQQRPIFTPQSYPSHLKSLEPQALQQQDWLLQGRFEEIKVPGARILKPRDQQPRPFGVQMLGQHPSQQPGGPYGKRLSREGREINFGLPPKTLRYPRCVTPVPLIGNNASRANCPVEVPCDSAVNRDANIPSPADPITYFKLRWTVVRDGTAGSNIDQNQINAVMNELNNDFLPARIQFCTEGAQFVTDVSRYDLDPNTEDFGLKITHGDSSQQLINVYVVGTIQIPQTSGQTAGYAFFPYDFYGGTSNTGGVVLSRIGTNLGTHALTHELGHVFGLHHTFRGVDEVSTCTACYERVTAADGSASNGDTEGDWCSDTNPHPVNAFNCFDPTSATNACDLFAWNNTPVNNFMSYSGCSSQFTSQQMGRMYCMISSYLGSWTAFGNSFCGNQPPVVDFQASPVRYVAPSRVTFTDQTISGSTITAWNWNFDVGNLGGVSPTTFSGQTPPPVTYSNPGLYTVSLTATNANGSNTETRTAFIEVLAAANDCDTLDAQWTNPTPTSSVFSWNPPSSGWVTGVPNSNFWDGFTLSQNTGFYERFVTPTPGLTTVGAVRLGLGGTIDNDSSMSIDVRVYNDDGFGAPDLATGLVGGVENLNVRGLNLPLISTSEIWVVFSTPVTPTTSNFHVGVEMNGMNSNDRLVLESSTLGEGENDGSNHSGPTLFNYNADGSVDFDLHIVPMLGEWPGIVVPTGFGQSAGCDTTLVILTDTVFFGSTVVSASFVLDDGRSINGSSPADIDTLFILFTEPPPATGYISTVNTCGRTDTFNFNITYAFNTSPDPDFSKTQANPVCIGSPGIDFTASPVAGPTIQSYVWDFGDGTTTAPLATNTVNHPYASNGLYYVNLTVTDTAGCTGNERKLDFIDAVDCNVTPPGAAYLFSPPAPCPGQTVSFSDGSLGQPDPPTSWQWNFGDGNFSTLQNPTHTYLTPGNYTVRLVASNAGGSSSLTQSVIVGNCVFAPEVELRARSLQEAVQLSWQLPSESGEGLSFQVERSADGQFFEVLDQIRGTEDTWYAYWDRNLPAYQLSYRLKVIDQDGSFTYSQVVEVRLDQQAGLWAWAYPNPLEDQDQLQLSIYAGSNRHLRLWLRNQLGQAVLSRELRLESSLSEHSFPTRGLAPGIYYFEILAENGAREVVKVVKR